MTGLRYKFRAAYLKKLWIRYKKAVFFAFFALVFIVSCVVYLSPHGTAPADLASRRIYNSAVKSPATFGPVFSVSTTFLDTTSLAEIARRFFLENSADAKATADLITPEIIPSLQATLLRRVQLLNKDSAFVAGIMDSLKKTGTPDPVLYVTAHRKNGGKSPFLYCILDANFDIVNAGFDSIPRFHLQTIAAFKR